MVEAAARVRERAGPALAGEGSPEGAWVERARGEDRIWLREEADGPPTFVSEGLLPGSLLHTAALIREAELGGLAGSLRRWRVFRLSINQELISYTSRLPWPLSDRAFGVLETYGGDAGEALILGEDTERSSYDATHPEALRFQGEQAEPGTVAGRVLCSAYRITALPEGCRLRRLTRIELALPLPASWSKALLARTFLDDLERLRAGLRRTPPGLAERIAQDPLYEAWEG